MSSPSDFNQTSIFSPIVEICDRILYFLEANVYSVILIAVGIGFLCLAPSAMNLLFVVSLIVFWFVNLYFNRVAYDLGADDWGETDFETVQRWHRTFEVPHLDSPGFPESSTVETRVRLLEEEFDELKQAISDKDIVEVADAFADMLFIIHGGADEFGLPFDEIFAEVCRSNFTKVPKDGKILRRDDGKILKPGTWEPPKIEEILEAY